MLISIAHAQEAAATAVGSAAAAAPAAGESVAWNMGLIVLMFVLFYFLLIRPQQNRLKKQQEMLNALQKGDRVVTGGGLIGTVSKLINDQEVEIDLGSGVKVVAVRYTITSRVDDKADDTSAKKAA